MSEPGTGKDFGKPFTDMAERIRRNMPQEFGGAVLIVGPDGQAIDVVMIGAHKDETFFWSTAKSKVMIECDEAIQRLEKPQGFGRPR